MPTIDTNSLMNDARCVGSCIPVGFQLPVLISIFANIADMSLDPSTLINGARCVQTCVPPGMQLPVLISLAQQILDNGGGGGGGGSGGNANVIPDGTDPNGSQTALQGIRYDSLGNFWAKTNNVNNATGWEKFISAQSEMAPTDAMARIASITVPAATLPESPVLPPVVIPESRRGAFRRSLEATKALLLSFFSFLPLILFLCVLKPLPSNAIPPPLLYQFATTNTATILTNIIRSLATTSFSTPTNLPFITPQQFGAVGDGTTDDWPALITWLNNAAKSNYIAFLPPAPGGSYAFSKQLVVTNVSNRYGFHIMGAGGPFHVSDAADTKSFCCLKQTTAGTNGIIITNDASGIVIEGIRVIASTYDYRSKGIAFDGTVSDSDCSAIIRCGVENFGQGIFIASAADTVIDVCSVGYCGQGVFMGPGTYSDGSIINNISIRNSQMSYANSNNIMCLKGNLSIYDTDIAQNNQDSGDTATNSHGLYIGAGGSVRLFNCRFENNINATVAQPCIIATNGGSLYMWSTSCSASPGANTYSLAVTNCGVYIYACSLNAYENVSGNFMTILDKDTLNGDCNIVADSFYTVNYILNSTAYTLKTGGLLRHAVTTTVTPGAGQASFRESGSGVDSSYIFGGKFNSLIGSSASQPVDLFGYYKDLIGTIAATTIIATNKISATNGFASIATTSAASIAATGWTNTFGINATVYVTATAVSFIVKNRANTTIYTSPTLTTTVPVTLQPGWAVTAASGLGGTALPW